MYMNTDLINIKCVEQDIKQYLINHHKDSIDKAVSLINKWLNEKSPSQYKNIRKILIKDYPWFDIVLDLLNKIIVSGYIPFLSLASMFHLSDELDKPNNTATVAEILLIINSIDLFVIEQTKTNYYIYPYLELPELLQDRIILSCYVPPKDSITKVKSNKGIILGSKFNKHDKPISLDVINTLNSQEYILDSWFVDNHKKPWFQDEKDTSKLTDVEKAKYEIQLKTWEQYQEQLEVFIKHLKDNPFYFEHKYDMRGRVYVRGYHFSTQGTSYEKACINLNKYEHVTGKL